jgi:hypothetical protein
MRALVIVAGLALTCIGGGCYSVVGIENLPPANDDAGSSSHGGTTGSTSTSTSRITTTTTAAATCPGVTVSNTCDQCTASRCCSELTACANDSNCAGAVGCFANFSGNVSAICGCLQSYGSVGAISNSTYFACNNEVCGATCGYPLGLGALCSSSTTCQPGPCAPDGAGTYRCLQFCCYSTDCPGAQTCRSVNSLEGLSTRVCL